MNTADDTINTLVREMAEKLATAVDVLTKEQFSEALRQAVLSGDFVRHVLAGSYAQAVVYIPYAEKMRLTAERDKLRELVENITEHDIDCAWFRSVHAECDCWRKDVVTWPEIPKHFVCEDCGSHVHVDEDGCCSTCGLDCLREDCQCKNRKDDK